MTDNSVLFQIDLITEETVAHHEDPYSGLLPSTHILINLFRHSFFSLISSLLCTHTLLNKQKSNVEQVTLVFLHHVNNGI